MVTPYACETVVYMAVDRLTPKKDFKKYREELFDQYYCSYIYDEDLSILDDWYEYDLQYQKEYNNEIH